MIWSRACSPVSGPSSGKWWVEKAEKRVLDAGYVLRSRQTWVSSHYSLIFWLMCVYPNDNFAASSNPAQYPEEVSFVWDQVLTCDRQNSSLFRKPWRQLWVLCRLGGDAEAKLRMRCLRHSLLWGSVTPSRGPQETLVEQNHVSDTVKRANNSD